MPHALLVAALLSQPWPGPPPQEFGQRISIIGNTLADRMQHDGWLETILQLRRPNQQLIIRNLGFSGDELTVRLRSQDFGTPDQWLKRLRTDTVFAFFGYNESFAGEAGLPKFEADLVEFVRHVVRQKYNGETTPHFYLFSPIAHENLRSPHLPDGVASNRRLAMYTAAMRKVATELRVPFVDLFAPTQQLFAKGGGPYTINGVHLNERGNRRLAAIIERELFRGPNVDLHAPAVEAVRRAVLEKNHYWFNRYRTVDGYSMYGGRADLKFVDGQTNRVVMDRELEVLDVMTANRDRFVWETTAAVRANREPPTASSIDDSNTPPFIPVISNKPGPLTGGKHVFLSSEEAIAQMKLAKNLAVNRFASEESVKDLVNPVQMAFDAKGRMWVAVWPTYPHWKPKEEMNDKLLVLEDTDGDGQADKTTVFADKLHCPTGFDFYKDGVLIAQAPDLIYLRDADGDGKADVRERVLHGLDSADTHHTANSFVFDPGGALYFQEGTFHHTQVETAWGPALRNANAGVYRYEPRTQKFSAYISFGFANPHGHAFDKWGQDIVVDGTGANPFHSTLFSGHVDYPMKHNRPPQVYQQWTRPCPGIEFLSSRHFPPEMQGNLLVANVIGYQGILQYKITDDGASFAGTEAERLLSSTDPNFRPSDLKVGPDGAIYFIDWHNPIIGHMQHNLRDPSRDRDHGRIYRITYQGRPLVKPIRIAGATIDELLGALNQPEDRVKARARAELAGRDSNAVRDAVQRWTATLDNSNPEVERLWLEALWLMQSHDLVDGRLLERVLGSVDFRARAAAVRVLCSWRDRVPDALSKLVALAADPHPRVRLEAIRAASFFVEPEAMEVVAVVGAAATDRYIDFVREETLRTLEPRFKAAMAAGKSPQFRTDAGKRFLLQRLPLANLLELPRSSEVCRELLVRPGVLDDRRREALRTLAHHRGTSDVAVLLDTIAAVDADRDARDEAVVFDLVRLLKGSSPSSLAALRNRVEAFAIRARRPAIRRMGFVALVDIDGSAEKAWQLAARDVGPLTDFLDAVSLIPDTTVRTGLFEPIAKLTETLPASLAKPAKPMPTGRFVRIELPGKKRTLTLAEVEVFSSGKNVARFGSASQINMASGGIPSRAIDGNTSPNYHDGGQTHTHENIANPWWEVDLHRELPIEAIVIHNRGDEDLGKRLANFTLQVLDANRKPIFERTKQPAPQPRAEFVLGEPPTEIVARRAALLALAAIPGREADAFGIVAKHIPDPAAVRALRRLPASVWKADAAPDLAQRLLAAIRALPASARTTADAVDAQDLASALASLLPAEKALQLRSELAGLGVSILRLGTLPERMAYDKETLFVQAGRAVEIHFDNADFMPHNLVLAEPGSLEEIGALGEAQATRPDAADRGFVPQSSKILAASKLLQPRQTERIAFAAPNQPGVYPFVCTYPGHWRRMHGALYVVHDLQACLANPEKYLASQPLAIADPLLKDRRLRREWKYEDLSASLANLNSGRSYETARTVFRLANCVACHKLDGVGNQFGPELAKLDPKITADDILKSLLDPSAKIDEKFASNTFALDTGKVLTGLVVEESATTVTIVENPLASAKTTLLMKSAIESRSKSQVSLMPKGLLDRLSKEEILDLVAYVAARGNPRAEAFKVPGHGH